MGGRGTLGPVVPGMVDTFDPCSSFRIVTLVASPLQFNEFNCLMLMTSEGFPVAAAASEAAVITALGPPAAVMAERES